LYAGLVNFALKAEWFALMQVVSHLCFKEVCFNKGIILDVVNRYFHWDCFKISPIGYQRI